MPDTFKSSNSHQPSGQLGTFTGVFTPSILTILGIILFLRLGYVTGNAGLMRTLFIIAIANTISVLTTFSLSAISTNLKVKGGGDYYLISRTLGLEFGGALGLVLFLAQSVSIAFYCIGFGEAMTSILPPGIHLSAQIIAAIAVAFLFIIAWAGSDWASRFQYGVMVLLFAALASFFWGGFLKWDSTLLAQNWYPPENGASFWILFAIFFPAVTGFTQGVSMSGDLKDPGKSLPKGTFLAVFISIVIYFVVAIVFSATSSNLNLSTNFNVMKQTAKFSFLIDAGVIAATLSSAIASFLGAPRILQSLASDRIFPFLEFFAKGEGPMNNPRRGVLLSTLIAFSTIAMGNLNLVASVVSMFFLISYGLLNYATYYEASSNSPSFRPTFKWFSPGISLIGCIICLFTMMAIDTKNSIVAVAILFGIFQYLKRNTTTTRWSDSRRSHLLQQIRNNLIEVSLEPAHDRDWRPRIIALCDDRERRQNLLKFASWIEGDSGIITGMWILEGEGIEIVKQKKEALSELRTEFNTLPYTVFPLTVCAPDVDTGLSVALQSFGIGPLGVNTLLLNWFDKAPTALNHWKEERFIKNIRTAFRLGCNIVIFAGRHISQIDENQQKHIPMKIDIWWWGDASSRLMLLLSYLSTRHSTWKDAEIRLIAANYNEKSEDNLRELRQTVADSRIQASCEIIVDDDIDLLSQYSEKADLVLVPFQIKNNQIKDPYGDDIQDLIVRLKNVVLVKACEDIDLDAEPEEGEAAQMAAAIDALNKLRERAKKAEKEALKTNAAADTVREKLKLLKKAEPSDKGDEVIVQMEKELREAETLANKAARKAAKESAKAEISEQDIQTENTDIEKQV